MGKAIRKCLPSPPKWFLIYDAECFMCPNKNCGNCRSMRTYLKQIRHIERKQVKQELKKEMLKGLSEMS